MGKATINRRQFMQTGGRTVAGGIAVTLAPALLGADGAWAAPLKALDKPAADVLLRMCRVLYPHDRLHDGFYAECVESLDAKAAGDAALAAQLRDGVGTLDVSCAEKFLDLNEAEQVMALNVIEDTPFFQTVRGHMVVALYNNPKVWAELGYEGPSFPFGGYLERGFDDIDWLPES